MKQHKQHARHAVMSSSVGPIGPHRVFDAVISYYSSNTLYLSNAHLGWTKTVKILSF